MLRDNRFLVNLYQCVFFSLTYLDVINPSLAFLTQSFFAGRFYAPILDPALIHNQLVEPIL